MNTIKPPLGVMPRFIWDERRRIELQAAIMRYMDAGMRVPLEWIAEYNELVERQAKEDAN